MISNALFLGHFVLDTWDFQSQIVDILDSLNFDIRMNYIIGHFDDLANRKPGTRLVKISGF